MFEIESILEMFGMMTVSVVTESPSETVPGKPREG
jgi:hypothetical protein